MKVAVWDTYVTRKNGTTMHFDIIVPDTLIDETIIYNFGKAFLATKGEEGQPITAKECSFCHIETVRPHWEAAILQQGYFIFEMENCNG
ncbi:MAG TPA: DUF2024 family protein [Ferruginibacter sp.]|nr:DUF2024 family protein [Ferruginibacter sp.]HRE62766.1 DUF2024 family protein [Ferruginibacter sp.]